MSFPISVCDTLDSRSIIAKVHSKTAKNVLTPSIFYTDTFKRMFSPSLQLLQETGQLWALVDILVFTHLALQSQVELILLLLLCVVE